MTDCGPVVDLVASPGCSLVKDAADPKADFPACCPVYDCEEGTQVSYVKTPAQKKKEAAAAAAAAAETEAEAESENSSFYKPTCFQVQDESQDPMKAMMKRL